MELFSLLLKVQIKIIYINMELFSLLLKVQIKKKIKNKIQIVLI